MLTGTELKEKLIAKISITNDVELLQQISHLIDFEEDHEDLYSMSAEEEEAVNKGLDQLNKGEYISHEEAKKQFDQWLKK